MRNLLDLMHCIFCFVALTKNLAFEHRMLNLFTRQYPFYLPCNLTFAIMLVSLINHFDMDIRSSSVKEVLQNFLQIYTQLVKMAECDPLDKKKRVSSPTSAANSNTSEENPSEEEAKGIHLSENIRMFRNRRMSVHSYVYEGEQISGVFGTRPIAVKFVTPVERGISEARILLKLNQNPHSYVISLIQFSIYSDGFTDYAYIALEKCHGDSIWKFVSKRKDQKIPYDLKLMLRFCEQLNLGLEYIHGKNIIHKDLKPDNIFLSLDQSKIKIADFGMSQEIESASLKVDNYKHFGTNGYRAPETFGEETISQKTDIFSLGNILYFLLSNGEHPFGSDPDQWNLNIKGNIHIDLSHLLVPNKKTTQHLIAHSIEHQLDCRPTIQQVISHPCWTGEDVECNFDYGSAPPESSDRLPSPDPWLPIVSSSPDSRKRALVELLKCLNQGQKTESKMTMDVSASLATRVKRPSNWEKKTVLGRGQYGIVYLIRDVDNGRDLALNLIRRQKDDRKKIKAEFELVQNLSHDRIVRYYSLCEFDSALYIFMEYMPGDSVKNKIVLNGALTEQVTCIYTRQILEGLVYLHSCNVIHRYVKSSNVFRDLSGNVKLGDFSYAERLKSPSTTSAIEKTCWTSPEVIKKERYDARTDIWSVGCTVVEMLTTHPPWHKSPCLVADLFTIESKPMTPELPPTISNSCRDFVKQVFVDRDKRPYAEELMTHTWIADS